ncbi:hypothetical protein NKH18_40130 [Streptomyces sp. M10(2022)]
MPDDRRAHRVTGGVGVGTAKSDLVCRFAELTRRATAARAAGSAGVQHRLASTRRPPLPFRALCTSWRRSSQHRDQKLSVATTRAPAERDKVLRTWNDTAHEETGTTATGIFAERTAAPRRRRRRARSRTLDVRRAGPAIGPAGPVAGQRARPRPWSPWPSPWRPSPRS